MFLRYLTLACLTAAQLAHANHSTCSWAPLKSEDSPDKQAWKPFCHAGYNDAAYTCSASAPYAAGAEVAVFGRLQEDTLELSESSQVC